VAPSALRAPAAPRPATDASSSQLLGWLAAQVCTPATVTPPSNTSEPKEWDVMFLVNDECRPLVQRLSDDLRRRQYAVTLMDEAGLCAELGKPTKEQFRFLSTTHRVVWTMTSGLWTFRGCLETAKTAALRGIDVPLIRQDGAMWTNKIT
jgi:hypothetical protein